MESPEKPDVPAPTHWNTRRDPIKSFQCPYCKTRIRISEVVESENIFGQTWMCIAYCDGCNITMLSDDWRYYKEMELLQEL